MACKEEIFLCVWKRFTFLVNGVAKCWHLMSACYIKSIRACLWIVWIQILCPCLDFSEAEIYAGLDAKLKLNIFSIDSSYQIKDKSDKRCDETCACVSERWRQQHRHNTVHLSGDADCPGARWSLMAGIDSAAKTLRSWEAAPSLGTGAELLPWWRQKRGQGLVAICWPSALCEKASSLLCSGARLCRMLSHLFKAAILSLKAFKLTRNLTNM